MLDEGHCNRINLRQTHYKFVRILYLGFLLKDLP